MYSIQMEICNGEISIGPFGGPGGKDFSYRAKKAIKQIVVIHNDNVVESIMFKDEDGTDNYSATFGAGFHARIRTDTRNHACWEGEISVIPWGGPEGRKWTYYTPKDGIETIKISYGEVVHSIRFVEHGSNEYSPIFGGQGGYETAKIKLKYPSEYLTGIHGYHGYHLFFSNKSPTREIRSLSFETNVRKYGPFGVERGIYFTCSMEGGKII